MRSPLEIIAGEFDHALFTTFSLNLPFFERWVIPLLGNAHVRNIAVFADSERLGASLADPHVQLAGRLYHLHGIAASGVFHSKLILLTSQKQARLCVSSANLTVSGQLRNLECAAVFDSNIAGHNAVIAEACEYFRRIVAKAPQHMVEAVFDATAVVATSESTGVARFVHNLDGPIAGQIPTAPLTATAPFADIAAASHLGENLRFLADGQELTASEEFFAGSWEVEARRFPRPLHGKAYWQSSGGWAMVGSPNLTRPALLQRATEGNYETAVAFDGLAEEFAEPPSAVWDGDAIDLLAPRRSGGASTAARAQSEEPGSFSAWEDEGTIRIEGLPESTPVEYATTAGWSELGIIESGAITPPDGMRPHLLRTVVRNREALAIVHRVGELRIRRTRRPHTQSTRTLSGTLPLDPEGQRALEQVLGDLFALALLMNEERAKAPSRPQTASSSEPERLSEWLPARPDDEPRIPDLYHRAWAESRPVDVLLALARTALRLEEAIPPIIADELGMSDEFRDIDDTNDDGERAAEAPEPGESPPETTRDVLNRYRKAFLRRLDELVKFIAQVEDQDLADLAFQVTLIQHERLAIEVLIDGVPEPLVPPESLLHQKLDLLAAYLKRTGDDPLAMETARFHLAACLKNPDEWTPLEWEKLKNLAYAHGRRILSTPLPHRPVDGLLGMDLEEAAGWIEGHAARTDWTAIASHAAEYLTDAALHTEPFPHITGAAEYSEVAHAPGREGSPAWDVIGYGAIAGLSDENPYGVGVENRGDSGWAIAHILVVNPAESRLYEAVRRRADRAWLWRYYAPVGLKLLEDAAKLGPTVLSDAFREAFHETDLHGLPEPLASAARTVMQAVDLSAAEG